MWLTRYQIARFANVRVIAQGAWARRIAMGDVGSHHLGAGGPADFDHSHTFQTFHTVECAGRIPSELSRT